jgi:hypothetical protein
MRCGYEQNRRSLCDDKSKTCNESSDQQFVSAIELQSLVTVASWSCLLSGAEKGLRHIGKGSVITARRRPK